MNINIEEGEVGIFTDLESPKKCCVENDPEFIDQDQMEKMKQKARNKVFLSRLELVCSQIKKKMLADEKA